MLTKAIETILTRAMSDAAFADLLFANLESALAGYELTTEEIANLKGMSRADFAHFQSASPEERRSFSLVGVNSASGGGGGGGDDPRKH
jgi:hypothetical protein